MKKLFLIPAIAILWGVCGYYAHGHVLGAFTREFPDQNQEPWATNWSYICGPFAFVIEEFSADRAIWLDKGYTCQQRWDAFKDKGYESLGKTYFVSRGDNYDCKVEDLK